MGWQVGRVALLLVLLVFSGSGCQKEVRSLRLGGGPAGGTFHTYARGMADVLEQELPGVLVRVERSGGSVANFEGLLEGKLDMALVYAGDAWPPQAGVSALARLYGAPAQLVVRANSSIQGVRQLRGRRVAIGNPGSGAAKSAERFFRSTGLWDSIIPVYLGYSMALDDLKLHNVEAVWELVGLPSASLVTHARRQGLRFLDLGPAARASGFYSEYPFYTPSSVPGHTYPGQEKAVSTFEDTALWLARTDLDPELVFQTLEAVFSQTGLDRMRQVHPAARELASEHALTGIRLPLHAGAQKFWGDNSGLLSD